MAVSPPPPPLRRTCALLPWLLVLAAGCFGPGEAGDAGHAAGTVDAEAGQRPYWIWRQHDLRHVEAASFYAARDFELAEPPPRARLRIFGDESYVLYLNGERIGSNQRLAMGTADEFEVGPWLRHGPNRIVVELRSATGAGGFWLALAAGSAPMLVTDASWTIYHVNWRGLFEEAGLAPGERPWLLGREPLGRWGSLTRFVLRPAFSQVLSEPLPIPAPRWRVWGSDGPWRELPPRRSRPESLGPLVEIDFGEVRSGFLQLAYRDSGREDEPPALLRFGLEPIPPPPVESDQIIRPVPGRNLFQEAVPRRFRYVAVAGLPGLFGAEVLAVSEASFAALGFGPNGNGRPAGVFGVAPPRRSRSPVENEVWRELERTAGLALRKER